MNLFDHCVTLILKEEGGYVNHPNDPGGETKYGISKRSHPNVDIKNLTVEQAKEIYRVNYWNRISADKLPPDLALIAFDCAVNQGVGRATQFLSAHPDPLSFMAARILHYASLPTWPTFGLGWMRRIGRVSREAAKLASAPERWSIHVYEQPEIGGDILIRVSPTQRKTHIRGDPPQKEIP
jgi:lysozyme family protein